MDVTTLIFLGLAAAVVLGAYRRRENFLHNVQALGLAIVVGSIVFGVMSSNGAGEQAMWFGFFAGAIVYALRPRRKRYIPARERRIARAQFELSGEKYNPRKHHFDHDVPFSRGGSNTADNLRVRRKRDNLRKGAKPPWWDVIGKF